MEIELDNELQSTQIFVYIESGPLALVLRAVVRPNHGLCCTLALHLTSDRHSTRSQIRSEHIQRTVR